MRALLLLALALALGACSSGAGGTGSILRAGAAQVLGGGSPAQGAAAAQGLTREDFEAAGRPVFRLRLVGRERFTLFTAVTQNADVTGYATPLREYVGLRGAQIVATRALGADLLRSTSSPDDPLARPTPPEAWPAEITRSYEMPGPGSASRVLAFRCSFEPGARTTRPILGLEIDGIDITETCQGETGSFQNLHFAEAGTGRIWRSIQWTGPDQGLVDIEIIVPGP